MVSKAGHTHPHIPKIFKFLASISLLHVFSTLNCDHKGPGEGVCVPAHVCLHLWGVGGTCCCFQVGTKDLEEITPKSLPVPSPNPTHCRLRALSSSRWGIGPSYPKATAPAIANPRAADFPLPRAAVSATVLLRVFSEIPSMNFKTALACGERHVLGEPRGRPRSSRQPPSPCRSQADAQAE